MKQQWYSARELAGLPGLPSLPNNVTRKAKDEQWQTRKRIGRGGGQEFAYNSLPVETQAVLAEKSRNSNSHSTRATQIASPRKLQSPRPKIKTTIEQRTDAWLEILKAHEFWCSINRVGRDFDTAVDRDRVFVQAYNKGELDLPDWVYAYRCHISRSTLKEKQKLRREAEKITALGGNYGKRKGKGTIDSDPELQEAIKACLAAGGQHWGPSQIYDILQLEFGLDPEKCSIGKLRAWLHRFRQEHPQEWALYMVPDRAKGTVSPAFGSRSENIFRPNQVWEIDTMRCDIDCKYELAGTLSLKRCSVMACVDVYCRRVLLLVTETANAEAACLLLAAAILKWGVPENIRSDHGKEFINHRVQRFLANLRVNTEDFRCLPGYPEQKPFVERFNRTFQHRDLVKSPYFVGHSVSDRQTLRQSPNNEVKIVELAMSPYEFQQWCDVWQLGYEQRPHGRPGIGLEGKSPLEVLVEAIEQGWVKREIRDPRELDFLMMQAPGKQGTRKVGRQGVSVCGRLYIAAELATWIGKRVFVCFNPHKPKYAYIYRNAELTEFICEAVWRDAEGVDLAAIASRARKLYEVLLRSINQIRKRGKALLRKLAKDPYLLLGKTAQELLVSVQSEGHDYAAIQAVAAAIATSENSEDEAMPAIDLESYQRELVRLEVETEKLRLKEDQARRLLNQLEDLVEQWHQQQSRPDLTNDELETIVQYVESGQGYGHLVAVTASQAEEQRFKNWLTGKPASNPAKTNLSSLLQTAFNRWRAQQEIPLEDRQLLMHYIKEPEGLGVLRAIANDAEERQFKSSLLQEENKMQLT